MGTRFITATALLAAFLAVRKGPGSLRVPWQEFRGAAIVGSLLLGVGIGMVALAERYVPSGVAALIVAIMPVWVVLLRRATGDHPARVTWIGVAVGLVGMAVLVLPGAHVAPANGATEAQRALWSLLMPIGTMAWAYGSFLQPRIRTPRDPLVLTAYEMLVGGSLLCVVGLLRGERLSEMTDATARSWIGWGYLVVIGSLFAYTTFVWLVGHAPLSLIATYAYVNPVVAVLLGAWIKAEPITLGVMVGGSIIVAGVALVVSGERLA